MPMLNKYLNEILNADSISEYDATIESLINDLHSQGKVEEASELKDIATIRKNLFSSRAGEDDLSEKKDAVKSFLNTLIGEENKNNTEDIISTVLRNFPEYCRNLYITKIHEKCSSNIKEHLTGFHIENEYDLQKLMLPLLSAFFLDARIESVQDTGHHAVRKDIVIDSVDSAIELKCTRLRITERQLSEEIASDMVHYDASKIFFYIYDKAGIIQNPASFIKTYETKDFGQKQIKIIIYSHHDI